MDHGDSMERGETEPLLYQNCPSIINEEDKLLKSNKGSYRNAPATILAFEFLESTAFFGISANLVVYLRTVLHGSNASNAANANIWTGTSFFTPILGAILADTYWGNYQTVFASSMVYLLGLVVITSTAIVSSPCIEPSCQAASIGQNLLFFSGLYLVACGSGGVKAGLLPLGADQFDENNPEEREKKELFFNCFYVCMTSGLMISGTLIVWIQENIGWAFGFSIATLCMALALGVLVTGRSAYQIKSPSNNPLKKFLQVFVASFSKMRLEVPNDGNQFYEIQQSDAPNCQPWRLGPTDDFRFLDKAAVVLESDMHDSGQRSCWKLCTRTEVEEVKRLLRLLPIWATGIIFSAAYSQMATTFIQQGGTMNTSFGFFSIPPASLTSLEVINVIFWVSFYNKIIVPVARRRFRNGEGLTQLQRIGIGRFLIIITMVSAAIVEKRRLKGVKNGKMLSIGWQFPQYFLIAASEVFNYISQIEFFYDQAPDTMKSISTSLALLSISLGSYLSSIIIEFVQVVTKNGDSPGWLPDNLNDGRLDCFFWAMASICAVNFAFFLAFAKNYRLNRNV